MSQITTNCIGGLKGGVGGACPPFAQKKGERRKKEGIDTEERRSKDANN